MRLGGKPHTEMDEDQQEIKQATESENGSTAQLTPEKREQSKKNRSWLDNLYRLRRRWRAQADQDALDWESMR